MELRTHIGRFARLLALTIVAASTAITLTPQPAAAQSYGFEQWQPRWDRGEYDRHHIILGRVAAFEPYRLQLAHPDGAIQPIDLKNGTVIRPRGLTLAPGQFVAVAGYWSRGTFIADRVILRGY
jgi:hypothetical protein